MVEIEQWSLNCAVDDERALSVFRTLDEKGYPSLTWSVLRMAASLVGAEEPAKLRGLANASNESPDIGFSFYEPSITDLFLTADPCLLHLKLERLQRLLQSVANGGRIVATAVYEKGNRPDAVDRFLKEVAAIIAEGELVEEATSFDRVEDASGCLESVARTEEMEEALAPEKAALTTALALADKKRRDLLLRIKTKSPALVSDLVGRKGDRKAAPRTSTEELDELVSKGLLEKEYVVLCRKTSVQVWRADSNADVESAGGSCASCGRAMKDEQCVEAVRVGHACDELLLKSRWMRVLATTTLILAGVAKQAIRVPPEAAGSDVLDLVFCFDNDGYLMELKDGDFEEPHASTFAARLVGTAGISRGVIACTGVVKPGAKRLLDNLFPVSAPWRRALTDKAKTYEIVEGPDCVLRSFAALLGYWRLLYASSKIGLSGTAAGISTIGLLRSKLRY